MTDVDRLLEAGADKVSINSTAIKNPQLITEIANRFGTQICVCAIDAKLEEDNKWHCYTAGGRYKTDKELLSWAKEAQDRGAGEILFTSINHDGVKQGYACEILAELSNHLQIPIIASGGAGNMQDFLDVFTIGKADAALAASMFHFGEIKIPDLKQYLKNNGIVIRT